MDTPADDLLCSVIDILERLELRYFVTGSVAAIYYGEPRFTNDIDVVVDLPAERIPERSWAPSLLASITSARRPCATPSRSKAAATFSTLLPV